MIQISAIISFYKYDKIFVSHLYGEPKRSQCKHQYRSDVNIFSTTTKYLVNALKLVSHEYDAWHTRHLCKYKRERKAENNDNDYLMPGISFFQPTYNAAWMLLHKSFRRFFPVKGHKNNTIYSSQHPHVHGSNTVLMSMGAMKSTGWYSKHITQRSYLSFDGGDGATMELLIFKKRKTNFSWQGKIIYVTSRTRKFNYLPAVSTFSKKKSIWH